MLAYFTEHCIGAQTKLFLSCFVCTFFLGVVWLSSLWRIKAKN